MHLWLHLVTGLLPSSMRGVWTTRKGCEYLSLASSSSSLSVAPSSSSSPPPSSSGSSKKEIDWIPQSHKKFWFDFYPNQRTPFEQSQTFSINITTSYDIDDTRLKITMFFVNAAFGQLWRDNEDYNENDDDDDDDTKKRWTVRLILPSGASWSEVLAKPIMWLSISSDKIILTSSLTKPPIITKHIMHKCYLSIDVD